MWGLPVIFAATALGFSMIEKRLPRTRPEDRVDALHVVLSNALPAALLEAACFALLALFGSWFGHGPWTAPQLMAGRPMWLQLIVLFGLTELSFYWVHRAMHRWPRLWRVHELHHTPREMTWLVGYRKHVLETAIHYLAPFLPLALLGFSPQAWALLGGVSVVFTGMTHLDVRWHTPRLGRVIVTPDVHAWHHAAEHVAHRGNYAGKLSLLDDLFGTRIDAETPYPARLGTDRIASPSWWSQQRLTLDELAAPISAPTPEFPVHTVSVRHGDPHTEAAP